MEGWVGHHSPEKKTIVINSKHRDNKKSELSRDIFSTRVRGWVGDCGATQGEAQDGRHTPP